MNAGELAALLATYPPELPVHVSAAYGACHITMVERKRASRQPLGNAYPGLEYYACLEIRGGINWTKPEPEHIVVRGPMRAATKAYLDAAP